MGAQMQLLLDMSVAGGQRVFAQVRDVPSMVRRSEPSGRLRIP
jgi:hypothetical protein